jgi:hypothetical protein
MTQRPSQFNDPAMDVLLNIVLSLGCEVYTLRDRLRIIEKKLEANERVTRADIEAYKPTPEEEEDIRRDRDEFMARLFRVFESMEISS